MNPRYRRLSYVLFGMGEDALPILGARCPDKVRFAVGRQLTDALKLDEEALGFLRFPDGSNFLLICTDLGVGVLDRRYADYSGVGIYWHIHGDRDSLCRLINHGVLGDRTAGWHTVGASVASGRRHVRGQDLPVYHDLMNTWEKLTDTPVLRVAGDANGYVYGSELSRVIEEMAGFAGCFPICAAAEPFMGRARCRRPQWLEICLLYLLTEAKNHSADGTVRYRLGALGGQDGEGLSLEVRYLTESDSEEVAAARRHFARVGELHGMDFHAETVQPKRGERQKGILPEVRFYLDWLRDPTVLATSDLKVEVRFETEETLPAEEASTEA